MAKSSGDSDVLRQRKSSADSEALRQRKRLNVAVKQSLRELRMQLSLLNLNVSASLELREVDLDCLDLLASHGPLSPSALARRAGLHPATVTGILDRLERGSWIARERDPADRRAIVVRPLHQRNAELVRLFAGMNSRMDDICASYTDPELELLADFLTRTAAAGRDATSDLASD